ncbi:hypothetical protein HDU97_005263 [Phlyctochytrium planicorne]|nr:hypothetical protein HDU97_005263 [Phlyctochytrium planicorne]
MPLLPLLLLSIALHPFPLTKAQYASYAVTKDAVYYVNRLDHNVFYQPRGQNPINIIGYLNHLSLYGSTSSTTSPTGPSMVAVGTNQEFYLYGGINTALPPPNPHDFDQWKSQGGFFIDKVFANPTGTEFWGITFDNRLFRWNNPGGGFTFALDADFIAMDLFLRENVYFVTRGGQVCQRNFDVTKNRIMVCVSPSAVPRLVTVGESHLYVLTFDGSLLATPKPLTSSSEFYDTGFKSIGATLLGIAVDHESLFILDVNGSPAENICSAPSVNCVPTSHPTTSQASSIATMTPPPSSTVNDSNTSNIITTSLITITRTDGAIITIPSPVTIKAVTIDRETVLVGAPSNTDSSHPSSTAGSSNADGYGGITTSNGGLFIGVGVFAGALVLALAVLFAAVIRHGSVRRVGQLVVGKKQEMVEGEVVASTRGGGVEREDEAEDEDESSNTPMEEPSFGAMSATTRAWQAQNPTAVVHALTRLSVHPECTSTSTSNSNNRANKSPQSPTTPTGNHDESGEEGLNLPSIATAYPSRMDTDSEKSTRDEGEEPRPSVVSIVKILNDDDDSSKPPHYS